MHFQTNFLLNKISVQCTDSDRRIDYLCMVWTCSFTSSIKHTDLFNSPYCWLKLVATFFNWFKLCSVRSILDSSNDSCFAVWFNTSWLLELLWICLMTDDMLFMFNFTRSLNKFLESPKRDLALVLEADVMFFIPIDIVAGQK